MDKLCPKCQMVKDLAQFSPSQAKVKGGLCRSCISLRNKQWLKENPEKNREKNKRWREKNLEKESVRGKRWAKENPEKHAEKSRRWREKNPEKHAKLKRASQKKQYRQDPIFRARSGASRSIREHIKVCGDSKDGSPINDFLPWTWEEYKAHMESLFLHPDNLINGRPWMTWHNQGRYLKTGPNAWDDERIETWTWQLDHVIPHSTFKYTSMEAQEFRDCWALSNLRPLSAKQNILDGVHRTRHKKA